MSDDELRPPPLDDDLVARLADLAATLDGSPPPPTEEWLRHVRIPELDEFNRLAGLSLRWEDFQGVYGAEEHEVWVRRALILDRTPARPELTREELVTLFQRAVGPDGAVADEDALTFLDATVERSWGVSGVTDLIFWPNEWFGDDDLHRSLTPEQVADAVWERAVR